MRTEGEGKALPGEEAEEEKEEEEFLNSCKQDSAMRFSLGGAYEVSCYEP